MLTDEEIMAIRNRAKLNDNRQIDPLPFARDVINAVLAKAMPIPKQEPAWAVPDGYVPVRADVIDFLNGSGELIGCGFGEKPDGERGTYWWRRFLPDANDNIQVSPRITEHDAREIIDNFMNQEFFNVDVWLDATGRALLNKLNANAVAEVRQEPVAIASGFRWRAKGNQIWDYVFHRAPDSWELREAEIEWVEIKGSQPVPAQAAAIPEITDEMRDADGEALYGISRESAIEIAKEDKFDSYADQAVMAFEAMLSASQKPEQSPEPEVFAYDIGYNFESGKDEGYLIYAKDYEPHEDEFIANKLCIIPSK